MKIAIGLPTAGRDTSAACLLDWAGRAEEAGFSSLAVLDRIAYRNHDAIPVLAAVAAVTRRIGLLSAVLLGPVRGNGTVLAKQLAGIDDLSGGRLTVGIAAGARPDDFDLTGTDFGNRGREHDQLLTRLTSAWRGGPAPVGDLLPPASHTANGPATPVPVTPVPVTPVPVTPVSVTAGGPPLLIGGSGPARIRRVIKFGAGWICGSGGPEQFAAGAARVRAAWSAAGRIGQPRLAAVSYFALGPDAARLARDFLGDYYGFRDDAGESVITATPTGPAEVTELAAAMAELGCDELVLYPCSADTTQLDLLTGAVPLSAP
ncbi:MAG TPA: LLM class flavin-dependent oxidoreductase [Trebonia sp.]|jgi:alkanesulfonate monooxygenase SsuD/methylene tetrahydromethanopterin reductase-like flavin-dependent oxidoreductase (luciferase family)|nr:LLM class flavin-dependent oxidoreductase [Trebonia sp.]